MSSGSPHYQSPISQLRRCSPNVRCHSNGGSQAHFFTASLFLANGLGTILPQTKLESDYWYQANRFLIQNARAGDVIITDGGFISDTYLNLYTRSNIVPVHGIGPKELGRLFSDKHPGRVWVSSWTFEPLREVRAADLLKERNEAAIQSIFEKVKARLVKKDENPWQTVWQLEPPTDDVGAARGSEGDRLDSSGHRIEDFVDNSG